MKWCWDNGKIIHQCFSVFIFHYLSIFLTKLFLLPFQEIVGEGKGDPFFSSFIWCLSRYHSESDPTNESVNPSTNTWPTDHELWQNNTVASTNTPTDSQPMHRLMHYRHWQNNTIVANKWSLCIQSIGQCMTFILTVRVGQCIGWLLAACQPRGNQRVVTDA